MNRFFFILFVALNLLGCSGGSGEDEITPHSPSSSVRFGISGITASFDTSEAGWRMLLDAATEARVEFLHLQSPRWSEVETSPGRIAFPDFDPFFALNRTYGLPYTLDIATPLGLGAPDLPPDLQFRSFDDRELATRYLAFVDATLKHFPHAAHIVFHTETAGSYFESGSPELEAFCSLIDSAVRRAHEERSGLKAGVYLSVHERSDIVRCLNRSTDFYGVSYLADRGDENYREALAKLHALPADRPIALAEAGIPTSPRLGGSESTHAAFVDYTFDFASELRSRILFVSFYQVFDEDPAITRQYVPAVAPGFTKAQQEDLIAFLSSLGLHREDTVPKPAWNILKDRLRARQEARASGRLP